MPGGHLQIRGIKKTDEGTYNCEARVMTRGEIDFRMIKVIVNGKHRAAPSPPAGLNDGASWSVPVPKRSPSSVQLFNT